MKGDKNKVMKTTLTYSICPLVFLTPQCGAPGACGLLVMSGQQREEVAL